MKRNSEMLYIMKTLQCLFIFAMLSSVTIVQSVKSPSSSEGLKKMMALRQTHGNIIPANSDLFKKYVKSAHREYSVVAMFTALKPGFGCQACPGVKNEFSVLVSSYASMPSSPKSQHVFFVVVDYHDSQEAFKIMKLEHVPGFYYFPGSRKRMKTDTYNARRSGYGAHSIARWLADIDGIKIKITLPFDYSRLTMPVLTILVVAVVSYLQPAISMRVLRNRWLWGFAVMAIVLLMTSGQMWNHIRKPAEAGRNGDGIQYILGSRSGQYILETYIVMAVNFAVAVGFILLDETQSVKHHIWKNTLGFLGIGMVVICFGLLISIFRMKSSGYPYSFLFG